MNIPKRLELPNSIPKFHGPKDVRAIYVRLLSDALHFIIFSSVFSFQIFNAARQLSHIEAAPDKSGLVLLDYWVGLKQCLVIIHN